MTVEIAIPKSATETVAKGPEFNDRDRINDILAMEKYLTQAYNTGLNEMQNPRLHETIQGVLSDTHNMQNQVFDQMWKKGWYKIEAAEPQKVSQAYEQFNNYKSQFPKFQ
jgi:spore coat protein CotF